MVLLANPGPFWNERNSAYMAKLPLDVMMRRWDARVEKAVASHVMTRHALKIKDIWFSAWKSMKCRAISQAQLLNELSHLVQFGVKAPTLRSSADVVASGKPTAEEVGRSPHVNNDGRVDIADLFLVTDQQVHGAVQGDGDPFVGRTAWYGDALFHVDTSTVIFRQFPDGTKGSMTKIRQTLESNAMMKAFLLEGTDIQRYLGKNLSVRAVGSAFECLYCQATQHGRARAFEYCPNWVQLHKHPDFPVVDKLKKPGCPRRRSGAGMNQNPCKLETL